MPEALKLHVANAVRPTLLCRLCRPPRLRALYASAQGREDRGRSAAWLPITVDRHHMRSSPWLSSNLANPNL